MDRLSEARTDLLNRHHAGYLLDDPDTYVVSDPERHQGYGLTTDDHCFRHDTHPDRPERWSLLNQNRTMLIQTPGPVTPGTREPFRLHDLVLPITPPAPPEPTAENPPGLIRIWAERGLGVLTFGAGVVVPIMQQFPGIQNAVITAAARAWHSLKRVINR